MTVVYLPIGPPACGKSTLVARLVESGWLSASAVICPDDLREWLTGRADCVDEDPLVFELLDDILTSRLRHDQDVWVDATNLHRGYRDEMVRQIRLLGGQVVSVWFEVAPEEIRRRNASRVRVVPDAVLTSMLQAHSETRVEDLPGVVMAPEELLELVPKQFAESTRPD